MVVNSVTSILEIDQNIHLSNKKVAVRLSDDFFCRCDYLHTHFFGAVEYLGAYNRGVKYLGPRK